NGDPLLLVAQASSRTMNPSLAQSVVDRAMERDPASASAEYGAEFRKDIESFISIEAVRACVAPCIFERSPERRITYKAFVDPSGGSADSFTLAIAHYDISTQTVLIDAVRETTPPFSPELTVLAYSNLLKSYRISKIMGDRYAGIWPVEQFSKFGITYEQAAR